MTTGEFSRNIGKLFSELKLVTDNLLFILLPYRLLSLLVRSQLQPESQDDAVVVMSWQAGYTLLVQVWGRQSDHGFYNTHECNHSQLHEKSNYTVGVQGYILIWTQYQYTNIHVSAQNHNKYFFECVNTDIIFTCVIRPLISSELFVISLQSCHCFWVNMTTAETK